MNELRYTLVSDGSSDAALVPILTWLLRTLGVEIAIQPNWADLGRAPLPSKPSLADKVRWGIDLYPCDLLFVHRDTERDPRLKRVEEIDTAVTEAAKRTVGIPPAVCVIPVRMQEAWLLFDESAIKCAAGNRAYNHSLHLPDIKDIESLPDPKTLLYERLKRASDLGTHRLRRFRYHQKARRVAEYIEDFSPLRALPAFAALEQDLAVVLRAFGWSVLDTWN